MGGLPFHGNSSHEWDDGGGGAVWAREAAWNDTSHSSHKGPLEIVRSNISHHGLTRHKQQQGGKQHNGYNPTKNNPLGDIYPG